MVEAVLAKSVRVIAVLSLGGLAVACMVFWVPLAWASPVSPLPASDYAVQPVCAAPAPGHAGCLAQLLVPETAVARAHTHPLRITSSHPIAAAKASEGAYGLRPQDLNSAYFPGEPPDAPASEPQTIALVDAYNDLDAEADLKVYDEEFSSPECTSENSCFEQVNQNGEAGDPPFPGSLSEREQQEAVCESATAEPSVKEAACTEVEEADEWGLETSLDIEVARAVCQNCRILLVESDSSQDASLEAAEDAAVKDGAGEVSDSWGGEEPLAGSEAFNHPGTVITVAAGDDGYLNWDASAEEEEPEGPKAGEVNYPASSPDVVAVSGTSLTLSASADTWSGESVWRRGGGGCSLRFTAQEWQRDVPDWSSVGCEGRRAVADISADAAPGTGVAVYDSVPYVRRGRGLKNVSVPGWETVGGTSLSSPIIASMFALAGGAHGVAYPAQTLYSHLGSSSLHDITEGANGKCEGDYSKGCTGSMAPLSVTDCGEGVLICNAAAGYDGPSGVGTPNGIAAFEPASQHGPAPPIIEPAPPETSPVAPSESASSETPTTALLPGPIVQEPSMVSTATATANPPVAGEILAFSDLSLAGVQHGDSLVVKLTVELARSRVQVEVVAPAGQMSSAAKRGKRRLVVLARLVREGLAAGRLRLSVALDAKGRRALRRHRHLTLTVRITVTPPAGQPQTSIRTITLEEH